jgi:hypothetical protein
VGSATYTWSPSTGNTVTIQLPSGTSDQYVELSLTANSVQNPRHPGRFSSPAVAALRRRNLHWRTGPGRCRRPRR